MRVAWLGPAPMSLGGVPYLGGQLLSALADSGIDVEAFFVVRSDQRTGVESLTRPGLRIHSRSTPWHWSRWYAQIPLANFITEQSTRAALQVRLTEGVARRHAVERFDALVHFSQFELLWTGVRRHAMPPIVLYPQVHAAGELRWHGAEEHLSQRSESTPRRLLVRSMLRTRALAQRHDARVAAGVVVPSQRFARAIEHDYGVPAARMRVVPNAVDLERFVPHPRTRADVRRLLFVGRLSVRKGLDVLVDVSHRLSDLQGKIELLVAGAPSLWSDYSPLLADLHPGIGRAIGQQTPQALAKLYADADVLLQPSYYEPFGLTVAESLACGTPAIVTDVVGAAEGVEEACCVRVPVGDAAAIERAVREHLAQTPEQVERQRRLARSEALRCFAPSAIAARLASHLAELSAPDHAPRARRA